MTAKKKTSKKPKFNYNEWLNELDLNKYLKQGFTKSLKKEPKTLEETEKLLQNYLGE